MPGIYATTGYLAAFTNAQNRTKLEAIEGLDIDNI